MGQDRDESRKYDDMLYLFHHVSKTHAQMPVHRRASQFSPFAALDGHAEKMGESERLTEQRVELDEYGAALLDGELRRIDAVSADKPQVTVTYFQADEKKLGGAYRTVTKQVERIDRFSRRILFCDGTDIAIEQIHEISIAGE